MFRISQIIGQQLYECLSNKDNLILNLTIIGCDCSTALEKLSKTVALANQFTVISFLMIN